MARRWAACSRESSGTCRDRLDSCCGDPLVLTVDAGGTPPLTFYWQTNGVTFATTSSNTLVIGTSTLANTATYDVIISNV